MSTSRKRVDPKPVAPAHSLTARFIDAVKESGEPVTAADQLTARGGKGALTNKGSTKEFEALMDKLRARVRAKGIESIGDVRP